MSGLTLDRWGRPCRGGNVQLAPEYVAANPEQHVYEPHEWNWLQERREGLSRTSASPEIQKAMKAAGARGPRPRRPGRPGSWAVSAHIETLASLTLRQANLLLNCTAGTDTAEPHRFFTPENGPFRVAISYPIRMVVDLTIPPFTEDGIHRYSLPYLLWTVARQYKRIYRAHRRYGVWGHQLDDLSFEGVELMERDPDGVWRVRLNVSS